jgi:hypothetical protein
LTAQQLGGLPYIAMQTPIITAPKPCQYFQDIGAFWLIYLTNWALIVETIAMVMLCISTVWAYAKLPDGPSQGKAPLFVRYTVALWYLIQPLSLNLGRNNLK